MSNNFDLNNFVGSSNFTKMLANIFLFLVLIGCIFVVVYLSITNQPVPDYIKYVLGSGLGFAINLLGIHQGTALFTGGASPKTITTLQVPDPSQTPTQKLVQVQGGR